METTLMYLTGTPGLWMTSYRHFQPFSSPSSQQKRRMKMKPNLSLPSKVRDGTPEPGSPSLCPPFNRKRKVLDVF